MKKNVIPIDMSGCKASAGDGLSRCLNANDQRKVFGANQSRTMVGEVVEPDHRVVLPCLTPEREKRQNGRRFKDDGEPAFTLTAQDRHGVGIGIEGGWKAAWNIQGSTWS